MKENFLKPIIKENPVLVLTIGMCPTLAVTTTFEGAYIMGLSVIVVLFLASIFSFIFKPLITEKTKIPSYILIIASLVTVLELLMNKYIPSIYNVLGVYVSLIVVNCIILGTVLSISKENKLKNAIAKSLGTGVGFLLALSGLSIVREILGTGKLTVFNNISSLTNHELILSIIPKNNILPIELFVTPAGAFLSLAFIVALVNYIRGRNDKNESI